MKINKYTLAALTIVVLCSLGVLLVIQYQILSKDIENNRSTMELAIPGILSDLYDNMMFNRDLDNLVRVYRGTESFQFSSDSNPTDALHLVLKAGLDEVISLNYPNLQYQVDGFISDEYGCMIHRGHRPELPKAKKVMEADNHMCFCMILPNTLDISMTYTNKDETVIGNSASILKASFLLMAIILISFWFTIRTIGKQKKLSDLKRDFINNLTHEFKTPIFSISLASKSLGGLDEVQKAPKAESYLNLITSETKRLQTQVDKILQMALLDSGNLTLDKKIIDLHESIKNVSEGFQMIISEKEGSIKFSLQANNQRIVADETHLSNVLFNLIDNAQKFSEAKPDIEIITEDAEGGVTLTIKDHGIGMDATTQKYIFDQFYRAQTGNLHTVKGFGLGLSYVKKIIEFHKGTISLHSITGQGSTFKIYLPTSS